MSGFRRLKQHIRGNASLYQAAVILAGAVFVCLVFIQAVKWWKRQPTAEKAHWETIEEPETVERPSPEEREIDLSTPPNELSRAAFLRHIDAVYGGMTQTVHSMRKTGTLQMQDNEFEVDYMFRVPAMSRYHMTLDGIRFRTVCNGEIAWTQAYRDGFEGPVKIETGANRELILRNSLMATPPPITLRNSEDWSWREPIVEDGKKSYVIEVQYPGFSETMYFDARTWLCYKRERDDIGEDEKEIHITAIFSDFQFIDGKVFSMIEEVRINGESHNKFIIDTIELNPGILTDAFDPPADSNS